MRRRRRVSRQARPDARDRLPGFRLTHDAEIRHHIEERIDDLVSRGWESDAARAEAERRFGDLERIREEMVEAEGHVPGGGARPLASLAADLRIAVRGLAKRPVFAVSVVATLALGLGVASAIFAAADAVLMRPLPYDGASRWTEIFVRDEGGGYFSPPTRFLDELRDGASGVIDRWVVFHREQLVRTDGERPEALSAVAVRPGAATALGIPVQIGRGLVDEDADPGRPGVAVLTHEYWIRSGADAAVVGTTLRLEGRPMTVVGVLAPGARFPIYGPRRDVWIPLRSDFSYADREPLSAVQGVWARVAADVERDVAEERVRALATALNSERPGELDGTVLLRPLDEYRQSSGLPEALGLLGLTATALLLIASINCVNLLLVRATERGRETALRTALGASRSRLLRQNVAEGLVLGLLSGAAAVGLGWVAIRGLGARLPQEITFFSPYALEIEGRTLSAAFAASVAVGVLLGVLPWLHSLRSMGLRTLYAGPSRHTEGRSAARLRRWLVVGQVALSMTLLGAAGLLMNGLVRLLSVDPGYDWETLAFASIPLSPVRYPDPASRFEIMSRLSDALEARPEIESVTVSGPEGIHIGVRLESQDESPPAGQPEYVAFTAVAVDFFETMGIEILEGRALVPADAELDNVMVDADLARYLWSGSSPIGRRFRLGEGREWLTVVGVFEEWLSVMGRDERSGPYQILYAADGVGIGRIPHVAVRTSGRPEAVVPLIHEELYGIDPEQWVWEARSAAEALADEEGHVRFIAVVMGLLSAVAVSLASVGLYGVLSYAVRRRRREMGVRVALGAYPRDVRRMVLGEGMTVAAAGVALGLLGWWLAAGLVDQLLYEVEPGDPLTGVVVATVLLVVASLASSLPALRATRVDPVEALRAEV